LLPTRLKPGENENTAFAENLTQTESLSEKRLSPVPVTGLSSGMPFLQVMSWDYDLAFLCSPYVRIVRSSDIPARLKF